MIIRPFGRFFHVFPPHAKACFFHARKELISMKTSCRIRDETGGDEP